MSNAVLAMGQGEGGRGVSRRLEPPRSAARVLEPLRLGVNRRRLGVGALCEGIPILHGRIGAACSRRVRLPSGRGSLGAGRMPSCQCMIICIRGLPRPRADRHPSPNPLTLQAGSDSLQRFATGPLSTARLGNAVRPPGGAGSRLGSGEIVIESSG